MDGDRTAFGVFDLTAKEGTNSLMGNAFIKKKFSRYAFELQNFFIIENKRNKKYGTKLYERIEKHCKKNGCELIEIEVPCEETKAINFFLKKGFIIDCQKKSILKNQVYFYEMHKDFSPLLSGRSF